MTKIRGSAHGFADIQQTIRRPSNNLSLLMSELCSLLCLKPYSLNHAIAEVQNRLLRLLEFGILVLH